MTARQRGTVFVAISAALYSIAGLCIKLIPWSGMAINGTRAAIALVVIGIYLAVVRHPLRFNRWILLGAVAVCTTNILFSIANKMTTAANAIVLQFTVPIFVMLFSLMFFGKKPQKLDIIACAVVFGGIVFFFLDSLEMGGGLGNLLALLSGVTYAGVFMLHELPDSDAISSVFWGGVISTITGLPFLAYETEFTTVGIVCILALGVLQVGVAYICLCIGLKSIPSVTASLISGVEPVLNPVLVALFYHEEIGVYAMIGGAIVFLGVLVYNVLQAAQIKKESDEGQKSEITEGIS